MVVIKISNIEVYGLYESMVASGYPMLQEVTDNLMDESDRLFIDIQSGIISKHPITNAHYQRACKLGGVPKSTGHDNFLKGIIVQADFEAPSYWWPQAQRYSHFDIVSSQSKMHRLTSLLEEQGYDMDDNVRNALILYHCNELELEDVLTMVPMGLELTARVTTNYLQLKNMYSQRKHHELEMWKKHFTQFVEGLPLARELGILGRDAD